MVDSHEASRQIISRACLECKLASFLAALSRLQSLHKATLQGLHSLHNSAEIWIWQKKRRRRTKWLGRFFSRS